MIASQEVGLPNVLIENPEALSAQRNEEEAVNQKAPNSYQGTEEFCVFLSKTEIKRQTFHACFFSTLLSGPNLIMS